ncbi:MAG: DNA-directed RNA polymerase subunit D, partial [Candidatus Micrarchaeota archaeon]|nr:DNA-directed RNA polymerase subunit D [Candidatus Micrarchaeota archaeon]
IEDNNEQSIRFTLTGSNYSFANALRRGMINSVGTLAIDKVTFYENSSAMFDEYIAHRIGLIPITTPKDYDQKDEVVFSLSAEGPGIVYSKELVSTSKGVKVANEKIPIIKLAEGQKLKLDGKAVFSNAQNSAKFQPGLVTYKANDESNFEFYIETFGQMPPADILHRALNAISDNIKDVHKEIKK